MTTKTSQNSNFTVNLSKESFKFSSSHFTIFSSSQAESLHGHNYYVTVKLTFNKVNPDNFMTNEFQELKQDIKSTCDLLDEKILISKTSPYLQITKKQIDNCDGYWVKFQEKRYFFPEEDIKFISLTNITCESLSQYLATYLLNSWQQNPQITDSLKEIHLSVEETRGQSVTFTKSSPNLFSDGVIDAD